MKEENYFGYYCPRCFMRYKENIGCSRCFKNLKPDSSGARIPISEQTKPYMKEEKVDHPPHYTKGGIECIDGIKASMTLEAFEGYLKGNVMKYLWRYKYKNGVEDLKKAQWYLNKLIDLKTKEV